MVKFNYSLLKAKEENWFFFFHSLSVFSSSVFSGVVNSGVAWVWPVLRVINCFQWVLCVCVCAKKTKHIAQVWIRRWWYEKRYRWYIIFVHRVLFLYSVWLLITGYRSLSVGRERAWKINAKRTLINWKLPMRKINIFFDCLNLYFFFRSSSMLRINENIFILQMRLLCNNEFGQIIKQEKTNFFCQHRFIIQFKAPTLWEEREYMTLWKEAAIAAFSPTTSNKNVMTSDQIRLCCSLLSTLCAAAIAGSLSSFHLGHVLHSQFNVVVVKTEKEPTEREEEREREKKTKNYIEEKIER